MLFELALKTGMRQGELLALTWGDVDLVHSVIHVRRTYTDVNLGSPKSHEKREVELRFPNGGGYRFQAGLRRSQGR